MTAAEYMLSDPDPIPGRPRYCLGCGARHPYQDDLRRDFCGACVFGMGQYHNAADDPPPEQLARCERPLRAYV